MTAQRSTGEPRRNGVELEVELPLFDAGGTRNRRNGARLAAGLHEHVQLGVEVRSAARLLRETIARLGASGEWEELSTPSRDARLKASFRGLGTFVKETRGLVDQRVAVVVEFVLRRRWLEQRGRQLGRRRWRRRGNLVTKGARTWRRTAIVDTNRQ